MGGQHGIGKSDFSSVDPVQRILCVTGTTNPDCTGLYRYKGLYNGYPYYARDAGSLYISYLATGMYVISIAPGYGVGPHWEKTGTEYLGDYQPMFPVTGVATANNGKC